MCNYSFEQIITKQPYRRWNCFLLFWFWFLCVWYWCCFCSLVIIFMFLDFINLIFFQLIDHLEQISECENQLICLKIYWTEFYRLLRIKFGIGIIATGLPFLGYKIIKRLHTGMKKRLLSRHVLNKGCSNNHGVGEQSWSQDLIKGVRVFYMEEQKDVWCCDASAKGTKLVQEGLSASPWKMLNSGMSEKPLPAFWAGKKTCCVAENILFFNKPSLHCLV